MRLAILVSSLCLPAWGLAVEPAVAAAVAQQELSAALTAQADVRHGAQLFATPCASCHGPDAAAVSDGSVPALAGQRASVVIRQLLDYRNSRRWDLRMENFSDSHHLPTAQDIADVAGFVAQLTPAANTGVGNGRYVQRGQQQFQRRCASCHGAQGEGSETAAVPRLAAQHYAYLLRQMHDAVEGRRPNFSPEHKALLARFEMADFVGVADYLARLPP
ncbi:MAG: c-type cytochrome [Steroidobacteraceae bacterium]